MSWLKKYFPIKFTALELGVVELYTNLDKR